jgi:dihydrofolate reductase
MYVFSRTLQQQTCAGVTVSGNPAETLAGLRSNRKKMCGFSAAGRSLPQSAGPRLVDSVEVAVVPVLLGGGVPMIPRSAEQRKLILCKSKVYPKTGTVSLEYAVDR